MTIRIPLDSNGGLQIAGVIVTPEIHAQILAPAMERIAALESVRPAQIQVNPHYDHQMQIDALGRRIAALEARQTAKLTVLPHEQVDPQPALSRADPPPTPDNAGRVAQVGDKQGDEAAVDRLRAWSVGYEYYYDAYFGPDAPFGNQQPTAATLAEVLQDGARLVPQVMMAKDAEIASLREKLREAITAIGATAGDRDRLAAQVAELTRERDEHSKAAAGLCGRNIALEEQRDRALAELAALDSPSGFGNCDALHGLTLLEKAQKCMRVIRKNPHAGMVEQQQHEIGRLSTELAAERERARIATAGHEKWHAEAMQLKERAESDRRVSDTLMEAAKQATRERDAARADADKYKAELERHIGMLLGCVKERDRALTELAEARSNRESWKLAAVLGSVGDIPVGSTADDVKRIACQSADALRAELADSRKRWEQRAQDDKFSLEKMGRALAAERERREKAERTMLMALAPDPALAAARAEIERLKATGGSLRFGTSQLPCSKEVEGAVQATFFELNNRIQRAEAELRQRDENQAMQEGVISKLNAQLKEAESRYALAKGGWDGANQRAERAEAAMERGDYASSAVERELRASLIEEQKANNRLQRELDEVRSRSNQVQGVIRGGIIDFSGAPQTWSSTTPILPPPQTKDPLVLALMRVPLPNDRGTWFLYEENAMRLAAALRSGLISEELKEVNGRLAALQVTANELVGLLDAAHEDVPGHTILWTKIRDALTSYREKYPC